MKISTLQVQKFRSIDDITISIDQILAIVGANNAGKSHILRALNAFFNYNNERDSFASLDHLYSARSRPKITVTFSDICPEDGINPEYVYNDKLIVRFTYRWDRKNPSYDVIKANRSQPINLDQFEEIISHYRYIYVPIVRNYKEAIFGNDGIAYRLLKATFLHQIANRNTIQPLIDKLMAKVESTIFRSAIADIKRYYPLGEAEFSMQATNLDVVDLIIRAVSLHLLESSQSNEINNCGS